MVGDVGMQIWAWHPGLDQISAKDDSIWHEKLWTTAPSADSGAIIDQRRRRIRRSRRWQQPCSFSALLASEIAWQTSKSWFADGPTPDWNDSLAVRDVSERWAFLGAAWFYDSRGHYVVWYWISMRSTKATACTCTGQLKRRQRPRKGRAFATETEQDFFLIGYRTI